VSGRLVVVSNRVAPIDEGKTAVGGLAVAVLAAFRKSGGLWFGWSGETVGRPDDQATVARSGRITYATIDLMQRDLDEYYSGFANSTLWPLFHYRLDLTGFSRRNYAGYLRVNGLFAARLAPLLEEGDLVWVHDYHLIPLGEQLRQMGLEQRIGFFLHTPFPVPAVLSALPSHDSLVRALCAYDVLGFQTAHDRDAFLAYAVGQAGVEVAGERTLSAFGRTIVVDAFPISIETPDIERHAAASAETRQAQRLRDSLVGRQLIIGVDRLDYSKGLPERFQAFDKLLETHADNRGRVTFMQIAPPTRTSVPEYVSIRRELETLAGHVNGRFADFDWVPIRYLNRSYARRTLLGFYRSSSIGLVTPLRDGMNLVAKEYVAAQDPDDPGVLVLSQFAGAAAELDAALLVNPYDAEGVAESLQRGLTMPAEERRERHQQMLAVLRRNDIMAWRDRFVDALAGRPHAWRVSQAGLASGRRG
jgi:trehalose 6-phosphate synthase